jgi:hypothetical protein
MQRASQASTWRNVPKQLQQKFKGPDKRGQLLRYIGRRLTSVDVFNAKFILCKLKIEPATLGSKEVRVPYYHVADAKDLQAAEALAAKWRSVSDSAEEGDEEGEDESEGEGKGRSSNKKKRNAASVSREASKLQSQSEQSKKRRK